MKKQRYELIAGKSVKFWEVQVRGSSMTTAYGRIGTKGQSRVKGFMSPAAAKSAAEKLIAQKINKGYSKTVTRRKTKAGKLEEIFRAEFQKLIADDVYNEYVTNDYRKKLVGLAQFPYFSIDDRLDMCLRSAEPGVYEIARNPDTPPTILRKLANFYLWSIVISPAIEANPNCPSDVLEKLAYYKNDDARLVDASSQKAPPATLRNLAADEEATVRVTVAENPNCPIGVLKTLAEDRNSDVREAVARNQRCPSAVLGRLAEDDQSYVHRSVAKNPGCPISALKELADDKDEWVRHAVSENPNCPLSLLRKLAKDPDGETREGASVNPNWPATELKRMAGSDDKWIRAGVAQNQNTRVDVLRRLTYDTNSDVIQAAATNPICPVDRLKELATDKDRGVRQSVALNPKCPVTLLNILSSDKDKEIRWRTFANPRCPPRLKLKILETLTARHYDHVRRFLANYIDCSEAVLKRLAADKNGLVREAVAQRTDCPPSVLRILASDKKPLIREIVAESPSCPPDVLEKLARDTNWRVQVAVANNPVSPPSVLHILDPTKPGISVRLVERRNCPVNLLEIFAKSSDDWVRTAVAEHPNCPVHVLEALAKDKFQLFNPAAAVARRLNCPTHILERLAKDEVAWVRQGVASNASAPPKLIHALVSDRSPQVALAALANRRCPRSLRAETIQSIVVKGNRAKRVGLAKAWGTKWLNDAHVVGVLAQDSDWQVRKAVAGNPSTPTSSYQALLDDDHPKVRLAAGLNVFHQYNDKMIRTQFAASPWMQVQLERAEPAFPGITEAVKNGNYLFAAPKTSKAVRSKSLIGRIIALSQPDVRPEELARASGYRDWRQRMAIARNPVTPADILKKLSDDENPNVAAQAGITIRRQKS